MELVRDLFPILQRTQIGQPAGDGGIRRLIGNGAALETAFQCIPGALGIVRRGRQFPLLVELFFSFGIDEEYLAVRIAVSGRCRLAWITGHQSRRLRSTGIEVRHPAIEPVALNELHFTGDDRLA